LKFPLVKEFHSGVVFENLKELHWWPVYKRFPFQLSGPWRSEGFTVRSLRSFSKMLGLCPSLEHLCLKVLSFYLLLLQMDLAPLQAYFSLVFILAVHILSGGRERCEA